MYYIILFIGVLSFLALVAWLEPLRRRRLARAIQLASRGAGAGAAGVHTAGALAAFLKGERKEDKPCLTPIDCVMTKRCAGHCGCR